ncbi:MAG: C69 family dipeptidase [Lachnospiraceae bacterium]|nr:C69 family dipeptidase [Lachnospiraceae bacterium]
MKVLFKGLTGILLGCVFLACASNDILAGTAVYVGKDVSAENTTLIGASNEPGTGACVVPVVIEKGAYKKGDVIECANGYKYTLPDDSVKLTLERYMTYLGYGEWNCCASNENGVSIVTGIQPIPNTAAIEADPFEACGVCEEKLALILASTAKTAEEAADILCDEYANIGADACETVLIADQNEAWLVENYSGHQYAAVKLPADKVAIFSAKPVITLADFEAYGQFCSEDLLDLPEEKGFAVYDDDKKLDLIKTYVGEDPNIEEMDLREWAGHAFFCDEEEDKYDPEASFDVFFTPTDKVSINKVFDFFRSRYEGTEYETVLGDKIGYGGIDNQFVSNVNVIQILGDVPAQMSTVIWTTPQQPVSSPFIPIPVVANSLPQSIAGDIEEDGNAEDSIQYDYAMLASKIVKRRDAYGSSVRSFLEGGEIVRVSDLLGHLRGDWKDAYASSPEKAAGIADEFTAACVEEEHETGRSIAEQLDWFIFRNGVVKDDIPDEDIMPFEIESSYATLGDAFANGWDITAEGDAVKAVKDGKTIEFSLADDGENSVKLTGFDNDSLIGDLFAENDDFVIELDDIEGNDDGLGIEIADDDEANVEDAAEEPAQEATETEKTEEPAEEAAEPEKTEEASEPEKTEEAAEPEKTEEAAEPEKAEEAAKPAEEPAPAPVSVGEDPTQVDTISELQAYFTEKIANVPRDGWAENEIATELADVSNDVSAILAKYINAYAEKYLGDLNGDFEDVEKIMSIDPNQAANELATEVANDQDIAKAGGDLTNIGYFVSGLLGNYFNSLAEDVTGDVVSGRLSQDGAVKILNEAATDIEGVVNAYVEAASGAAMEAAQNVKENIPPKEEMKETLGEIDDALDVLDEYGVIDKDAMGLGEAKLADLADLTDADIDVVITLNEMDDATINGLSQLLGVDVRAALDQYIEQIKAAGLPVTINK